MKNAILGIFLGFLITGCASFSTHTFRVEQTAVNVAYTAYVGYTNGLANGAIKVSDEQRNAIKDARIKLAASVSTLEQWRLAYEKDSSVKPQVQSALDAVITQSSNVVYLINLFKQ